MVAGAVRFAQPLESEDRKISTQSQCSLRLLTWNIGYAELEDDTRAHTKDMPAIAKVILNADPDAVALQELTGKQQLNVLLGLLKGRYRGEVAQEGQGDRFEAVRNGASYLHVDTQADHISDVNALLVSHGIRVYELSPTQESLEEAFLRITKH